MSKAMVAILALTMAASGGPSGEAIGGPSRAKTAADMQEAGKTLVRAPGALPGVTALGPAERSTREEPATREERAQIATIYSVFPGYGLGHFLIGEHDAGMRFLALELAATALWMAGPAVVAFAEDPGRAGGMGAAAPSATANAVFAIGLLAHAGLKVWEVTSARSLALERPDGQAPLPLERSDSK